MITPYQRRTFPVAQGRISLLPCRILVVIYLVILPVCTLISVICGARLLLHVWPQAVSSPDSGSGASTRDSSQGSRDRLSLFRAVKVNSLPGPSHAAPSLSLAVPSHATLGPAHADPRASTRDSSQGSRDRLALGSTAVIPLPDTEEHLREADRIRSLITESLELRGLRPAELPVERKQARLDTWEGPTQGPARPVETRLVWPTHWMVREVTSAISQRLLAHADAETRASVQDYARVPATLLPDPGQRDYVLQSEPLPGWTRCRKSLGNRCRPRRR